MRRGLAIVAALLAAQGLLLAVWLAVEGGRGDDPPREPGAAARRTTTLAQAAPDLALQRPDGTALWLRELRGRPLILHFWASWCAPCRDELPALLAYAAAGEIDVLAVSVDPEWAAITRFVAAPLPGFVARADGEAVAAAFGVRSLPVSFVVDRAGVMRLRLDGPRDWAAPATRTEVRLAAGQ